MHSVIFYFGFSQSLKTVLRQVGWAILVMAILESSIDVWITGQMQVLLSNPEGTSPVVYAYGLCSILISLLFPTAMIVMIVTALKGSWGHLFEDLNQVMIETLRTWGVALSWSFLLIVPGLIKWLRLSLVPFVVMLDPAYKKGEKDALQESERLTRGKFWLLLFAFVLMTIVVPLILTSFDDYKVIWRTPLASLLYHVVETLVSISFILWLLKIFNSQWSPPSSAAVEKTNESHI